MALQSIVWQSTLISQQEPVPSRKPGAEGPRGSCRQLLGSGCLSVVSAHVSIQLLIRNRTAQRRAAL